ncbi:invasion associated locus B family protein [Histidinibacterium lentulum]|nr:invasion associated locus B family protein [Histidinibacterium lentulum]
MTAIRSLAATLAAVPLALTLSVAPVLAQEEESAAAGEVQPADLPEDVANGTTFGDWVVACEATSIRRTVCRLVQTLTLQDSDQLVAQFIAVPAEDGAVLIAQVPMGVFLPGGAVYRFAENEEVEQREMVWQSCQGQICEAAYPLDDDELALMGEHDAMLFGYRMSADSDPIVIEVDISEFTRGIGVLRDALG